MDYRNIQVKDCPFCGAEGQVICEGIGQADVFYVKCCGCGIRNHDSLTPQNAAFHWNMRKPSQK